MCVVGYIMKREGRAGRCEKQASKDVGHECKLEAFCVCVYVCMCVLPYPCAYEPVKVVRICI